MVTKIESVTKPDGNSAARPSRTSDKPEQAHSSGRSLLWRRDDGSPIACVEKIKVLNENYAELRQMAQDAIEDGLLMGCSEAQMREALHALIDGLDNPYLHKVIPDNANTS